MFKGLKKSLLVLLSVVLVALFAGLTLRGMIMQDLRNHFEKESLEGNNLRYQTKGKDDVFIEHSGNLVIAWSFILTGLAFVMGNFTAPKRTGTVTDPIQVAAAESEPKSNKVITVEAKEKTANPSGNHYLEPILHIPARSEPEVNFTANIIEETLETIEDEPLEVEYQEIRPLADDPDRIKKIIKGLDELAKAQIRGRAMKKLPLELMPHLTGIIDKIRGWSENKDISFNLECENGLIMTIDADCLTGIMTSLLDNAAKAVKNGGAVTVRAAAKGNHAEFAIRDTGTGIRRKDLPHIFERFYRASGNGIGLGLTITKELVGACGGTIEVQSDRGKGSVVTVLIPLS
jgi:signal transduction histidine kinase